MTRMAITIGACCVLFSYVALADERAKNPYIQCVERQEIKDVDACLEKSGRIEWYPYKSPDSCVINKQILQFADTQRWKLSWKVLFMNERCRRLGEPLNEERVTIDGQFNHLQVVRQVLTEMKADVSL